MRTLYPFCFLIILSFCKKEEKRPLEDFSITGTITSCITGQPVSGAQIHLVVKIKGFLGSSEDGGETYSDNQGNYTITPYKMGSSGATDVEITVEKDGYFAAHTSIDATLLRTAHVTITPEDFGLGQPAYLKFIINNINEVDTNDLLLIGAISYGRCGPGGGTYLSSNPALQSPSTLSYDELKGMIRNGHITYMLDGNDSAVANYNTKRSGIYGTPSTIRTYCHASDTTVIRLDY